jgi:spore coat polysaccharide biosynthesis protein SpsF
VQSCRRVDEVVVATTDSPLDDRLVRETTRIGIRTFRGSENDVLSRYLGAAKAFAAAVVVRVTSDCPLFDGSVLDRMLAAFVEGREQRQLDYLSNCIDRTFPRGLDAEVFTIDALTIAAAEAGLSYEREHVTPYIYQHPERFRIENFSNTTDWSSHRWTLDTSEDYELISAVYSRLYSTNPQFTTEDVLAFLQVHPEIVRLNAYVEQ